MVLPADSELFGLLYDSNHYSREGASESARWKGINPREEDKAAK
jgi:hypothetical protein